MKHLTADQYLITLKETLKKEYERLVKNKDFIVKSQQFEIAMLYRNIEKKLLKFINELEYKTNK